MIKTLALTALFLCVAPGFSRGGEIQSHWSLDAPGLPGLIPHGNIQAAEGVAGNSLAFDGRSALELKDSAALTHGEGGFSMTILVNPYRSGGDQQMIVAKNRYSLNEREWSVMVDRDGLIRLYLQDAGWKTVASPKPVRPGYWHLVGVTVTPGGAELWIDGKPEGSIQLASPLPKTAAPLTVGGVSDNGRVGQGLVGAIDEVRLFDGPLPAGEMAALYRKVEQTHPIPDRPADSKLEPDPFWTRQGSEAAKQDRTSTIFSGRTPDKLACDTTLRAMPDGSWVMVMLGGGDREPDPRNAVFLSRSADEGGTWSAMERIDFGFPREGDTIALVPTELMVHEGRCTLFFATHDGVFGGWKEWFAVSGDSCKTWGEPQPAPGRLHDRTFIRNHLVTRDGRLMLPFQHYVGAPRHDPVNGVLISGDGGETWSEHGNIRLTDDENYKGWAENNIVELLDGRIAMIIRADGLGGVLYYAESTDGGKTWPEFARKTAIPNPGSKATLYGLGGNTVGLLHNPNPMSRRPLGFWISFDGMKTWPCQRILRGDLEGSFNYPDGFVSDDRQWLHFAFDHNRAQAIHVSARLPEIPALWDDAKTLPASGDLTVLDGVRFSVIKPYAFRKDGYRFLHGLGLCFHRGKLYASFGHNKGGENTDTEEARYCVSEDEGRTWGPVMTIDSGEGPVGVSHGSFLSHEGTLWAFMGAYTGTMQGIHTRAYTLDETNGQWQSKGTVIEGGFWPMQEPLKMEDGNWIMSGISAGVYDEKGTHPAAVAISQGNDFTKWDLVQIKPLEGIPMWGEATVIVDGKRITSISRYGGEARALVATSGDFGRSWSTMQPSNLPMTTSKPIAGILSDGRRYLVCTTTADSGKRRSPLTLAVSKPGEEAFSQVFAIRHAEFPGGPGESHPGASLSYPYAIEHDGHLYVGYSNSGDKSTRLGEGRELWNNNSAELAVIPLEVLK